MRRLGARMSYALPVYKIANSSWLQEQILKRQGQKIPFSTNGIEIQGLQPITEVERL